MNAESKRWEFYVDDAGRHHWRWPAAPQTSARTGNGPQALPRGTLQRQQDLLLLPLRVRGR